MFLKNMIRTENKHPQHNTICSLLKGIIGMFKTDLMYQCMEGEKQKRMIHVCRKSETTKQNYLKNVI